MKIFKSDIYGDCLQPDSFTELTKLTTTTERDEDDLDYEYVPVRMWRGQSNIKWKIDSAAYRRISLTKTGKIDNENLEHYEKRLLQHATHKGFRLQDGRELSDFELLAKLQHHGAATRLVDFSRNAFIGLWFCVSNDLNKVGILIGVHSFYIGGMESVPDKNNYENRIKTCKKHKYPQVYESPNLSLRISAQHAQFLYSGISNDITGSLQLPKEDNGKLFIAITPKLKKECMEILEQVFDFRTKTLFPDLDGFGMANNITSIVDKMDRW